MEFPIIVIKKSDSIIYYLKKQQDLLITTEELAFRKKVFNNTIMIDSKGYIYKIKKIRKKGYVGFFGFNPLLKNWWNDREIKIDIEFESEVKKIELDNLKEIVLEKIMSSKKFYAESWNIKDLKNALVEAISFREIIDLFK